MDKILLIDGSHGSYIPQQFAKAYGKQPFFQDDLNHREDINILLYGPDHDLYTEVWGDVLGYAKVKCFGSGNDDLYTLDQDGDLWAVPEGYEEPEEAS